jgi:hypothetical protein
MAANSSMEPSPVPPWPLERPPASEVSAPLDPLDGVPEPAPGADFAGDVPEPDTEKTPMKPLFPEVMLVPPPELNEPMVPAADCPCRSPNTASVSRVTSLTPTVTPMADVLETLTAPATSMK